MSAQKNKRVYMIEIKLHQKNLGYIYLKGEPTRLKDIIATLEASYGMRRGSKGRVKTPKCKRSMRP